MKLSFKRNVGPVDRSVRLLAGLTLIGLTYFRVIHVSTLMAAILYVIAGFLLIEAIAAY